MDEQAPALPPIGPAPSAVHEQSWPLERHGQAATVHLRHDVTANRAEIFVDGQPIQFRTVSRFDGVTTFLFVLWGQTVQIRATKNERGVTYGMEMSQRETGPASRPPAHSAMVPQGRKRVWLWVLVPVVIVGALISGLFALAASGRLDSFFQPTWKPFTSQAGQFRIDVPGDTTEQDDTVNTPYGVVGIHTVRVQRYGADYLVMYSDVRGPASEADPDTVMTSARDRALREAGGTLLRDRLIAVEGYPGRELVLDTPQGKLQERMFRWKDRLYQVMIVSGRVTTREDIDHFLGSFHLIGEPAPLEPTSEKETTPAPSAVDLRSAMVQLTGGAGPSCGFLVGGEKDSAYILTTSEAVTGTDGRLATSLSATRVVGDFDTPPAITPLLADGPIGLAYIHSPAHALPPSLPLASASGLSTKSRLRMPRCEANGDLTSTDVASVRLSHDGVVQLAQLLPALKPEQSGTPVIDSEGRVLGMTEASYRGSGQTVLIPTERIRQLLRGGLRGGAIKYRVAGDRCYFEAKVFVENPTGQLKKAGLILEPNRSATISDESMLHPKAIGAARMQAPINDGGSAELNAVVENCAAGFLHYQIELEDMRGETSVSAPHVVRIAPTSKDFARELIVEKGPYGGRAPEMSAFLGQPPARPWGFSFRCNPVDPEECRTECQNGEAASCEALGYMYETGENLSRDLARARELYLQSCNAREMTACTRYGNLIYSPDARKETIQSAKTSYQLACDAKEGSGCTGLGDIASDARELEKAVSFYRQGCDLKNSDGCTRLAIAYREGRGIAKDDAQALKFFERGCKGTDSAACAYVGEAYREGRGIRANSDLAADYYDRACRAGDGMSCNNLAVLIDRGEVTGGERARVVMLFRQACDLGDKQGCENARR